MKKLVLSVALGMFCYCTNNAMEENGEEGQQIKEIIDVIGNMIVNQVYIFNAKEAIKEKEKKIYATIKDVNGKVTKENLLNFIKGQFKTNNEELSTKGIDYLEQYFHLEKISEDEECTKDKLTEIFWEVQEVDETIDEVDQEITKYLIEIATSEKITRECFQEYYEVKKTEKIKKEEEVKKEEIIDEIMNECYKENENNDPNTNFLAKLKEIFENEKLTKLIDENFRKQIEEEKKNAIFKAIQRRITLDENITKEALRDFIKQEIGEEKKEEEKKDFPKGDKPAEEECCHCCDCWGKKKNQVENESSNEKPVKIYNNTEDHYF